MSKKARKQKVPSRVVQSQPDTSGSLQKIRDWISGRVAMLIYGAILGVSCTYLYQNYQDKRVLATYLARARNDLLDTSYRLRICSPFWRDDLCQNAHRPQSDLAELDHLAKGPSLRAIWTLNANHLVWLACTENFKKTYLPKLTSYIERLQAQWPAVGDSGFAYSMNDSSLARQAQLVEMEGIEMVGRSHWGEISGSMVPPAQLAVDIWRTQETSSQFAGNILDEKAMGIVGFKDGVLVIKGETSLFYIDLLRDTAYKRVDKNYYRFQGTIADRNAGKGYLPVFTIPDEIIRIETLLNRGGGP